MNHSHENDPDALRSDINTTRRRMDDTMDALGNRLQPQHLLDEVLGFFRASGDDGDTRLTQMREKLTRSADTALHAVVDSVKKNPVPALLIGAGVAWLLYESRRDKSPPAPDGNYYGLDREGDAVRYDPDTHYDRPLAYPSTLAASDSYDPEPHGDGMDRLGEKTASVTGQVKDKLSHAGDAAREKFQAVKERAGEIGAKAKHATREAYSKTRDRVAATTDQHPLEVGLVALAAGLIAGLALPTPEAVNRAVGPAAERLRQRTRTAGSEMLEKGKRVAQAAATAVKDEARAQGLTPDRLGDKATAVIGRATETAQNEARQQGLPGASGGNGPQAGTPASDPTMARPGV